MKTTIITICLLLLGITVQAQKALKQYNNAINELKEYPKGESTSGKKGVALAAFFDNRMAETNKDTAIKEIQPFLQQYIDYDFHAAFVSVMKVKNPNDMEMLLEKYFKTEEQRYVMQLADRFNKTTQGAMNGKTVNIPYPFNIPAPGTGLKNRISEPKEGAGNDEYFKARDAYLANNYAEALKLYKLSSEKGSADAMYSVGLLYLDGEGVTQSNTEAFKWFKNAADKGNMYAMFNIAQMYLEGKGVTKNKTVANAWFKEAAGKGHEKAKEHIDENWIID